MTQHVLVPYDGSAPAKRAADFVGDHHGDATITLVSVLDPMHGFLDAAGHGISQYDAWFDAAEDEAERELDVARSRFPDDTAVSTDIVVGQVVRELIAYIDEHDVDLIVMGSHGRSGVSRILLGSVAEQVVRRASVPVTVVR